MNNKRDRHTIEELRAGDHKAFEQIFIAYYNKTKAFINGYIKSVTDAEELTEDLFVELWINRRTIDTTRSFSSFLHTIARNKAVDFLRRKYVHNTYVSQAESNPYTPTTEEELIARELGLLIDEAIDKMPAQRKKIYKLSREEGLSNTEIADRLNTTKRTVESQLSLALKEIRNVISVYFITFL